MYVHLKLNGQTKNWFTSKSAERNIDRYLIDRVTTETVNGRSRQEAYPCPKEIGIQQNPTESSDTNSNFRDSTNSESYSGDSTISDSTNSNSTNSDSTNIDSTNIDSAISDSTYI